MPHALVDKVLEITFTTCYHSEKRRKVGDLALLLTSVIEEMLGFSVSVTSCMLARGSCGVKRNGLQITGFHIEAHS